MANEAMMAQMLRGGGPAPGVQPQQGGMPPRPPQGGMPGMQQGGPPQGGMPPRPPQGGMPQGPVPSVPQLDHSGQYGAQRY